MQTKINNSPLANIKVVDLTLLLPGPLTTMYLGDLGAEVIKIENPKIGDGTRYQGIADGKESLLYQLVNRNKKGITLNLKRAEGIALLKKLIQDADILVEGFRPGAMDKMGIGYETLTELNPRLIYCAISGYGATGPYRDLAGHDANYLSYAGILSHLGPASGAPILAGIQIADIAGGTLSALSSILVALYSRERTNQGQFIDISMMDGAFALQHLLVGDYLTEQEEPKQGNWILSGGLPNYNVYETKDERYVVLAALEERFFRNFLTKANLDKYLTADLRAPETLSELGKTITELFRQYDLAHWQDFFMNPDLCLTPVLSLKEALENEQIKNRDMLFYLDHPRLGKVLQIGAPFRLSHTPVSYRYPAPDQGQHNFEIYTQLGLSEKEMQELKSKRII